MNLRLQRGISHSPLNTTTFPSTQWPADSRRETKRLKCHRARVVYEMLTKGTSSTPTKESLVPGGNKSERVTARAFMVNMYIVFTSRRLLMGSVQSCWPGTGGIMFSVMNNVGREAPFVRQAMRQKPRIEVKRDIPEAVKDAWEDICRGKSGKDGAVKQEPSPVLVL